MGFGLPLEGVVNRFLCFCWVLLLSISCRTLPSKAPALSPKECVEGFLHAVEKNDFHAVHKTLSIELRARYTPERLRADFLSEPSSQRRLQNIRENLKEDWLFLKGAWLLPLGDSVYLRVVKEQGDLKIAALEEQKQVTQGL